MQQITLRNLGMPNQMIQDLHDHDTEENRKINQ